MKTKSPWARWSAYFLVAFTAAVLLALCGCAKAQEDLDRAPFKVYTGPETGCEYVRPWGYAGIAPRMDRDGKQVCK